MKHEPRYVWYDLIRGLSALAVFASHLRAMLLVDYQEIANPSPLLRGLYLATGLGHQAVMVFFVLSGFFVGGAIIARKETFRWSPYALARLSRLYTVLIPALALTWLLDTWVIAQNPAAAAGAYTSTWNSGPEPGSPWSLAPLTALGNLFFLQTIFTPVLGSNSPLWSLANEFWYYILFPLVVVALGMIRRGAAARAVCALLAVAILVMLPPDILGYGLIWLLGVGLAMFPQPGFAGSLMARLVSGALFLACLVLSKLDRFPSGSSDYFVALSFTLLAWCLKNNFGGTARLLQTPARWLSEISYTLYVVHFPLIFALGALVYQGKQFQPGVNGLGHFALWFLAIFLAAVAFWWVFERNTPKVRKLLGEWMKK